MKKLLGVFLLVIGLAHLGAYYMVSEVPIFYQPQNARQMQQEAAPAAVDSQTAQSNSPVRLDSATAAAVSARKSGGKDAAAQPAAFKTMLLWAGLGVSAWALSRYSISLPFGSA